LPLCSSRVAAGSVRVASREQPPARQPARPWHFNASEDRWCRDADPRSRWEFRPPSPCVRWGHSLVEAGGATGRRDTRDAPPRRCG
jgi:hypothetical protein